MERLSDTAIDIINELHTDRLDYTSEYLPLIDAADRLAAYEDTGLEPEVVTAVKHSLMGKAIAEIKEFDGIPVDRLRELAQAEQDGRLVVLPCKVGDTVYFTLLGRIIEKPVFSIVSFSASARIYCAGTSEYFRPEDFGKTVFPTREEAEAALAQKGVTHETNPV